MIGAASGPVTQEKRMRVRCAICGRFVGRGDMDARHLFVPSSRYGPEISEWECGNCVRLRHAAWQMVIISGGEWSGYTRGEAF